MKMLIEMPTTEKPNHTEPCADCVQATLGPWHGFSYHCEGCAARAVARGPNYRRARDSGSQHRVYRAELESMGVTHSQVVAAAAADQITNEGA